MAVSVVAPGVTLSGVSPANEFTGGRSRPAVCVLVPTRNEAGNVAPLVERLVEVLRPVDAEVLFVDDSTDSTPETIRRVAADATLPVRLLHRSETERIGGLGGAVVAGLRDTLAAWVVVMDGDLQHPPETVPELLDRAVGGGVDLVVASRYNGGGTAAGLSSPFRGLVSRGATAAAKLAFPRRLAGVTDPMTGFFAVRREALDLESLHPRGFKILLEILARTPRLRVVEVPFSFAARGDGESKASGREALRYGLQLAGLRLASPPALAGLLRFAAVGGTGVLVNLLALALVLRLDGRPAGGDAQALAATLATQVAIGWNFLLTEAWVFPDSGRGSRRWPRFAGFWLLSTAALGVQLPLAAVLLHLLPGGYVTATAVALGLLVVLRYVVCRALLYRDTGTATDAVVLAAVGAAPAGKPGRAA